MTGCLEKGTISKDMPGFHIQALSMVCAGLLAHDGMLHRAVRPAKHGWAMRAMQAC